MKNKILIVDDEHTVCDGCRRIFEDEGYSIKIALSGKEGLEKAGQEVFDVILVDLKMPDIDGMEVIKTIKKSQPDVAAIMITGYASVPTAVEAMKLGVEEFIPKPFTPEEIVYVVKKALERVAATRKQKTKEEEEIERKLIFEVVDRAFRDKSFLHFLIEKGIEALKEYNVSSEAKVAIASGDIRWLENSVGRLSYNQYKCLRGLCTYIDRVPDYGF